MIAERFRSLWWAAFAILSGLACYMVTQHVAAQRIALEKVEKKIRISQLAVRALETELGTRASMTQLERWNADTLALHAPKPEQYLTDASALASLGQGATSPAQVAAAAAVAQVAYMPAAPAASHPQAGASVTIPVAQTPSVASPAARSPAVRSAPSPVTAPVTRIAYHAPAAPAPRAESDAPVLRAATYVRPAHDRMDDAPRKIAMVERRAPLSAGTLAELGRIAQGEQSREVGGQ